MRKTLIITVLFLLSFVDLYSHTLRGTVYDSKTKLPISEVYVYLNGTSTCSITDEYGKFEITVENIINTFLAFSHLSYEKLFISNPFEELPEKIFMTEKITVLAPVIIYGTADPFTREEKLTAFREQFLGINKAGYSCRILNENDIHLIFDPVGKVLSATSDNPVIIDNEYLAYKIRFILMTFKVQFNRVTLDNENALQCLLLGATSFEDMNPDSKRINKRRKNIYKSSYVCFFKNFVTNTLKESKFIVFNKSLPTNHNRHFSISDTLSQKSVRIKSDADLEMPLFMDNTITGKISVLYNKKLQSTIYFKTDSFLVDNFGNHNMFDKILFSGHFGEQKVGNMLPIDYKIND
jgi:hypothetical protein